MIPFYRKIALSSASSFSAVLESPPLFDTPWHYHPELELILIEGSRGKRFMGDNISDFDEVELMLIGPNLPHFWKSDLSNEENAALRSRAIVVHFSEHFMGKEFLRLPEAQPVRELLDRARRGLVFGSRTKCQFRQPMQDLVRAESFDRIVQLLSILNGLAKAEDWTPLSSHGFVAQFNQQQSDRMSKVFEYIMVNFKEDISLEDIAGIAHMAVPAFCRYFKKSTGKTFYHFLREIRIGYACRLLIEDKTSVSQIGFASGFNNISNFNRQFKEVTNMRPLEYKKQYQLSNLTAWIS